MFVWAKGIFAAGKATPQTLIDALIEVEEMKEEGEQQAKDGQRRGGRQYSNLGEGSNLK
jgi:hypothetical protein